MVAENGWVDDTMEYSTIFGNALREAFGPQAAWYCLLAVGLNVHFGYTGLFNFGQVGFALVGAYGTGIAVSTLGWSLWLAIPIGLVAAVLLAVVLGGPTLRLRGDYFAIVTIAAAEILRLVVRAIGLADITGGPFGLQNLANDFYALNPFDTGITFFGTWTYRSDELWSGLVTWGLVAMATFVVWLLMRSPWGRVLKSIREDEDAARALGKNVFSYKMQSLILGGVIGALGGIALTLQLSTVNDITFLPRVTFFSYAILILGGAATTFGPILGSVIFWFLFVGLQSALPQLVEVGALPAFLGNTDSVSAVSFAVVGLVIMLLLIFRPQGGLGSREELLLSV